MTIPAPNFAITPYGDVDPAQLAHLREHFDTASLLGITDQLDRLRNRLHAGGGLRDDVLRLHRMAHVVINGAGLAEPAGDDDIWEYAAMLVVEMQDMAIMLERAASRLAPLAELRPNYGD